MAELKQEHVEQAKTTDAPSNEVFLENAGTRETQVLQTHRSISRARSESSEEREQRLRMLRDKQNDERQRKLEELKAQALAAQHFREIKEQERRKRIDELRVKENDRRQQVGERKRLIYEAERDRRESILKKNQERELRYEMKKRNERGSLAFAFGSSTPRMLEPADTGGSFWGYRRATSTSNILFSAMPLTRRSSERELEGSKKRATSAGGLDRNNIEGTEESIIPAGCASGHMGRRRTDLIPTIPSRDAASALAKRPFTKSPGRTYSLSRLDQLSKPRKPRLSNDLPSVMEDLPKPNPPRSQSQSQFFSAKSMSRSMSHLTVTKMCSKSDSRSLHHLLAAPVPKARAPVAQLRKRPDITEGPSRPGSSLSQQSTNSVSSTINVRPRTVAAPRKPRPASIAVTGVTHDSNKNALVSEVKKSDAKPPLPKPRKQSLDKLDKIDKPKVKTPKPKVTHSVEINIDDKPILSSNSDANSDQSHDDNKETEENNKPVIVDAKPIEKTDPEKNDYEEKSNEDSIEEKIEIDSPQKFDTPQKREVEKIDKQANEKIDSAQKQIDTPRKQEFETPQKNFEKADTPKHTSEKSDTPKHTIEKSAIDKPIDKPTAIEKTPAKVDLDRSENLDKSMDTDNLSILEGADMTTSMIAKIRITTEEEAKAALAERRRLAREEAERQALAEKLRIEREEERQRQEEEQLRALAEEQRKAEEERLAQAIAEAQKREEEERLRQQEELKQKLEKEEQDKKLQEENEKKKIEMEERLKKEGEAREARRKRVEAIMLRTRSKGSPGNQTKNDSDEKNDSEYETKPDIISNKPIIDMLEKESTESQDALLNGTLKSQWPIISQKNGETHKESQCSNGHKNEADNSENTRRDNHALNDHNVTNTLLALNEFDPFRNSNNSLDISGNKITMEDNVNSNNTADLEATRDLML